MRSLLSVYILKNSGEAGAICGDGTEKNGRCIKCVHNGMFKSMLYM